MGRGRGKRTVKIGNKEVTPESMKITEDEKDEINTKSEGCWRVWWTNFTDNKEQNFHPENVQLVFYTVANEPGSRRLIN